MQVPTPQLHCRIIRKRPNSNPTKKSNDYDQEGEDHLADYRVGQ
jgi:hypothetical protein